MKLTLKERITTISILPKEGSYATMTLKQDLFEKIKLKQEEIKDLNVKENDGALSWDGKKDKEKDYEISELETNLIKDELKKLDEAKKLNDDTINIYKKFN